MLRQLARLLGLFFLPLQSGLILSALRLVLLVLAFRGCPPIVRQRVVARVVHGLLVIRILTIIRNDIVVACIGQAGLTTPGLQLGLSAITSLFACIGQAGITSAACRVHPSASHPWQPEALHPWQPEASHA